MRKWFYWSVLACSVCVAHIHAAKYDYAPRSSEQVSQNVQADTITWQNENGNQYNYDGSYYGGNESYRGNGGYNETFDENDYVYNGNPQECCEPSVCGGECLTLCACYQPCYYNTWRCIQVPKTCKRKCCRYVPREYQVQHCRYIPQYYTETCCCYVPEYYYVDECVMCEKWLCERKCQNVPRYYYKRTTCASNWECCQ